jgi:hypothetical protein
MDRLDAGPQKLRVHPHPLRYRRHVGGVGIVEVRNQQLGCELLDRLFVQLRVGEVDEFVRGRTTTLSGGGAAQQQDGAGVAIDGADPDLPVLGAEVVDELEGHAIAAPFESLQEQRHDRIVGDRGAINHAGHLTD